MRFETVTAPDGVRLRCAVQGDGPRLVVLLHGFPECWFSWRHQLDALGGNGAFTVVAPELRGYGGSDRPPRVADYALDRLVDDVAAVVARFGRADAAIVGHDWGAIIAWATAAWRPEIVWRLAALQVPPLGAFAKNMTPAQGLRSWYVLFFQIPGLPERLIRARNFEAVARLLRPIATDAELEVYRDALRPPGAVTAAVNYYRALLRHRPVPKRAGHILAPTLFVYGDRDLAIVPASVRDVGAYVDGPYRELRLPGVGHWVQNEAPDAVNAALLSFLTDQRIT